MDWYYYLHGFNERISEQTGEGSADLSGYADAGEISDWAEDAMRWAVSVGLIQGRGGGVLAPGDGASRAEVAQLVMNHDTKFQ